MTHIKRLIAIGALLLAATSCSDIAGSDDPTASGHWVGTSSVTIDVTLAENDRSISGTGTIKSTSSIPTTIVGTRAGKSVSLTFSAQGFTNMNFTGELVGDDQIVGHLNGSGFQNEGLQLRKQ